MNSCEFIYIFVDFHCRFNRTLETSYRQICLVQIVAATIGSAVLLFLILVVCVILLDGSSY